MAVRVLIVDDEPLIVKGLKFSLEQEGYEVECAYNGEEALAKYETIHFDIILLDVMLPGISGTEVCGKIREASMIPIIMLTAKSADEDKICGLDFGADDYMTKPFNVAELKARMRNLLRRTSANNAKAVKTDIIIKAKQLVMNCEKRTVTVENRSIELTAKEFDILHLLITNPGKVYRREDLLELIWKDYSGDIRTVDVHIRRLRRKIDGDKEEPEYVYTKWGVGYYFAEN